ncbi:MAG TPA: DMT family transporter [Planktothrix sp.]|jgi:drug/metabolite transporter (DMT)-like permease
MIHILVLITLLVWGIAGVFDKKAVAASTNQTVFLLFHLFNFVLLSGLLVISFFTAMHWSFSTQMWLWSSLGAGGGVLAMLLYYSALSRTDASYVLGITAAYPVISSLLAAPILGEALSLPKLASATLVSLGVGLIGTTASASQQKLSARDLRIVLFCVLGAALSWGGVGVFEKKAVSYGNALEGYFAETAWELVFAGIAWLIFKKQGLKFDFSNARIWRFAWLSALCVAVGNYCILQLMKTQSASYAIVITACYPLVLYICALVFLKEKLSKMRLVGIVLVILGGILTELIH